MTTLDALGTACDLEESVFSAFDLSKLGSLEMLSGPPGYDPTGIGRAIAGVPRWRILGVRALTEFEPRDMAYRLKPEGMAFMVPVYMLSAMWLPECGHEAVGDLFVPPLNQTWINARAGSYGFDNANVDDESIAQSRTAYFKFAGLLSSQQRQVISDWLRFFFEEVSPAHPASRSLRELQQFWRSLE